VSRGRHLWILAGLTAVAAIVRFSALGHQSYDVDEAVTALRVIHPSLAATMHAVFRGERTPPLYYLLAWLWSRPFGTDEVGLRSLSALLGTVTVPAAYLAARELASRRAGLIAAALVAVNPYLIWYSQEARAYALYVLVSACALYFFARALRDGAPRSLALWALCSALSVCSYYFAVFLIIPEGLWLLYSVRPRRPVIAAVAATAIAGLALVPLAVAQQAGTHADLFTSRPLVARAGQALLDFVASVEPAPLTGSTAADTVQILAGVGAAVVFMLAIVIVARRGQSSERRAAVRVGVVAGASFLLPLGVATAGFDFVEPHKVLIGSVVPLLALGAVALGARQAGRLGLACAAACVLIFVGVVAAVHVNRQMQRPDWRAAAEAITAAGGPRVLVVARNGEAPLAYYLQARDISPEIAPAGMEVPEIETLSRGYAISPPGRGLKLVALRQVAGLFWLQRFRAPGPLAVSATELNGFRILRSGRWPWQNLVFRSSAQARGGPMPITSRTSASVSAAIARAFSAPAARVASRAASSARSSP
jgi:mannosyltransferase